MSRIFISYRRFDSAGYAGRLYDRLSQHFGDDRIFMDIDTIELGSDFVEVIQEAVGSCDVLIALIGRRWLSITDTSGRRRLDNPEDFVRLEIATALERNIRVIPVLVQGAPMPRSSELPDDLKELAHRNALPIDDRFHPDVDYLIAVIEKLLSAAISAPPESKIERKAEEPFPAAQPETKPQPGTEIKEPAPTPAPAAQPRSSNWPLFGGIGGGLLLVIILGSIFFSRIGGRADEPTPADEPAPAGATPPPATLPETITAADGSPMVLIPAGPFTMGNDLDVALAECQKFRSSASCEASWFDHEGPMHTVTLDAFYIDQYEVTNAGYAACVKAGDCTLPDCTEAYEDPDKQNHPVVCVTWEHANTYCEWRGDRLPTEAEWEKAARGTDGQQYPWGNEFDGNRLNFCDANCEQIWANEDYDDGYAGTAPVGSYSNGASPYSLYDMAGNVSEWVADWYDDDYYTVAPDHNPRRPDNGGEDKVLRGGSWYYGVTNARTSDRFYFSPDSYFDDLGFRCVADVPE